MKSYNTVEGIQQYLTDLAGLNRLHHDRLQAGYERKERLQEFCILGRWWVDSCGNFGIISENSPAELSKQCPPVLTEDQMGLLMRGESWGWTHSVPFPPEYAKCSVCDKPWTLENCHDFHHTMDHSMLVSLDDFVGQPISEVKQIPSLTGIKAHYINRETVHNEDLVGDPEARSGNNGSLWKYVKKDYVIRTGDHVSLQVRVFTHQACYQHKRAQEERAGLEKVFAQAGYPKVSLIAIPNEYWPKSYKNMPPWFLAQVGEGPVIKIGSRKRVLSISWEYSKRDLSHLFIDEKVTKEPYLIHAWTDEKAAEYLAKIIPALLPAPNQIPYTYGARETTA